VRLITRRISARLSARRRSRYAAPAVLVAALLASGGLYMTLAPAEATKTTDDAATIAKGKALFQVGCASCHGKNAEGILTERGHNYGPSLVGVGAAAVDFQVSTGRMPAAQTNAQIPQKPPVYTQEEIAQLAAYVASLAPGPAIPSPDEYDVSKVTQAEIVRGGELFRTNCTACHNFSGRGGALPNGRYAPSLKGTSPRNIYQAMLTGPQQMPVFSDSVLLPDDKRAIIAYVVALQHTDDPGGFGLGRLGPVSEGLWGWLVGIGLLVVVAVWIGAKVPRVRRRD